MVTFTIYLNTEMREHLERLQPYVSEYFVSFFIVELMKAFQPGLNPTVKQVYIDDVMEMAYQFWEEDSEAAREEGVMEEVSLDCFYEGVNVGCDIVELILKRHDIFGVLEGLDIHEPSFSLVDYNYDNHILVIEGE